MRTNLEMLWFPERGVVLQRPEMVPGSHQVRIDRASGLLTFQVTVLLADGYHDVTVRTEDPSIGPALLAEELEYLWQHVEGIVEQELPF